MKWLFCLTFLVLFMALPMARAEYFSMNSSNLNEVDINKYGPWVNNIPDSHPDKALYENARKTFIESLPQAHLLLLVQTHLLNILESYKAQAPDKDAALLAKYLNTVQEKFKPWDSYSVRSDVWAAKIIFVYSYDGRFQVEGVTPDVLAFNDGRDIYFNIRALQQKTNLSLSEATMLWLHEISHYMQEIPLPERDKLNAEIAQFVKINSSEARVLDGRRFFTLNLPKDVKSPEQFYFKSSKPQGYQTTGAEHLLEQVKNRFLILEQTKKTTALYEKAYESFLQLGDARVLSQNFYPVYGETFAWPHILVKNTRWNNQGILQIQVSSQDAGYVARPREAFALVDNSGMVNPQILPENVRIDIDPVRGRMDVTRAYGQDMKEGFFDLQRIEDVGERRFINLRIKVKDIYKSLTSAPSLHLIGKDITNQQMLSIAIKTLKAVSPDEVTLHLEVPLKNIELQQILVPQINNEGRYSEINIRPLRPQTLLGKVQPLTGASKVLSFEVFAKSSEKEPAQAKLRLSANRKIVGLTLDIDHRILARSLNPVVLPEGRYENEIVLNTGRKYYLDKTMLKQQGDALLFAVPESKIQQMTKGPMITENIGFGYRRSYRKDYKTIYDTLWRRISRAWLHYADGSVEILDAKVLPQGFSLNSETRDQAKARIDKSVNDYFDTLAIVEPSKPMTCAEVFK